MKGMTQAGRTFVRSSLIAIAAMGALATVSHAQDSTYANGDRMHIVRPGESLYDIAHAYLGDGDLWPEITRLNRRLVQDPHWIFPNEILRIPKAPPGLRPDSTALAAGAPAPQPAAQPSAQPQPTPSSAPEPSPTVAAAPTEPDTTGNAPAANDEGASSAPGATLFNHPPQGQNLFSGGGRTGGGLVVRRREGVAAGDHNGAPYMDRDGGPRNAGEVVGVVDVSNIINAAEVEHYGLGQELYLRMPRGVKPEVGQRLYTYTLGASFGGHGQVIEPTGIVTVLQPGSGNVATIARITQQFAYMQLHQGVLLVDPAILPNTPPSPLTGGAQAHVVWVEHNQVLPTVGYYVVLDAPANKGSVRVGDQITLFRQREKVESTRGDVVLPESDIAIAQVVRVTPFGISAVIIAQDQPAVEPGVTARVTARVNTGQ
jgi:nucleoid-associated protein YgaU